tara:strand:+ start:631 stop:1011 length:381 start_codon:yes stop_codon:yes gene_type:complete
MGRYYNGDIEGKFWFAVQSSNDADFFGSEGEEPNTYLNYHFTKDEHLKDIKKGIKECEKELGTWKEKLDKFFKDNNGYNDKMIEDQLGLKEEKSRELLEWYARLELGNQILECVMKQGDCSFEAEL